MQTQVSIIWSIGILIIDMDKKCHHEDKYIDYKFTSLFHSYEVSNTETCHKRTLRERGK